MNIFFTVKQAARIVGMTSETLRHYDRIGLVKPCRKDEFTGYRYYSRAGTLQLQTIGAAQNNGLNFSRDKRYFAAE